MFGSKNNRNRPAETGEQAQAPLFRDGPTAAQLADPESFWHVGDYPDNPRGGIVVPGSEIRTLYAELATDPLTHFELGRRWDAQVGSSGTGFYIDQARREANLPTVTGWSAAGNTSMSWPPAITDQGLSYYVHQALRATASGRLHSAAALAHAEVLRAEQTRCESCQVPGIAEMVTPVAGHRLMLCEPCTPVVAAALTARQAAEMVSGVTRERAAHELLARLV